MKKGVKEKVYKLIKAFYGLKQTPSAWYDRIDKYFRTQGFIKSFNVHTLYIKKLDDALILIVAVSIDDMLITGPDIAYLEEFKAQMMKEFE